MKSKQIVGMAAWAALVFGGGAYGQFKRGHTLPPAGGTAVMYRRDLILKGGGGKFVAATDAMYRLDATSQPPAWTGVAPMSRPRADFYLMALPDGNVLATGGHDDNNLAILEPELYDPMADT